MDKFVEVIYVPGIGQRIVSGTLFVSVIKTLLYRWLMPYIYGDHLLWSIYGLY
jgi:hypothetical protein